MLGREGDAFFVREPQPDEVLEEYEMLPEDPDVDAVAAEQDLVENFEVTAAASPPLGEAAAKGATSADGGSASQAKKKPTGPKSLQAEMPHSDHQHEDLLLGRKDLPDNLDNLSENGQDE